jgi:hypothetical protein
VYAKVSLNSNDAIICDRVHENVPYVGYGVIIVPVSTVSAEHLGENCIKIDAQLTKIY